MQARYANADGTDVILTLDGLAHAVKPDDARLEGVEIAPYAPSDASPRACTPREFRGRFTAAEKAALTLAASKGLETGDATLQIFLDDLSASQVVELDHPDVLAGMDALVAAKLLTRKRATAILAG